MTGFFFTRGQHFLNLVLIGQADMSLPTGEVISLSEIMHFIRSQSILIGSITAVGKMICLHGDMSLFSGLRVVFLDLSGR